MKEAALPSQEYLAECFDYEPESGVLTWRVRPSHHFKSARGMNVFNAMYAGLGAGNINSRGYFNVEINGRNYKCHRVIWKLITSSDPVGELDHKDTNKQNNAWINLREATRQENIFNQSLRKNNTTGYKGVSYHRLTRRFQASIRENGKKKHLGLFETAALAHTAYCSAAQRVHGEFFRSGS